MIPDCPDDGLWPEMKSIGDVIMKLRYFLCILIVICASLLMTAAFADVSGFTVDLPDSIEVGLKERLNVLYITPEGRQSSDVTVTCSDPDAMSSYRYSIGSDLYFGITMNKKGQYTWHFSLYDETIKDVSVTVNDIATVQADQRLYVVPLGGNVPFSYTIGSGTLYNRNAIGVSSQGVSFNRNDMTLVGSHSGYYTATILINGSLAADGFYVLVVDPYENISLVTEYDKVSTGGSMMLRTYNSSGKEVCAYIEITEGAEIAELYRRTWNTWCELRAHETGWVTVTAYGTDGSSASKRIRVCVGPTSINVELPPTIAAGTSMPANIIMEPEDAWCPVRMELNPSYNIPADGSITGPVAVLKDGVLTTMIPGTVRLQVYANNNFYVDITVTDSEKALVFERPNPYFDRRKPFQLSVHDKTGLDYPAAYTASGTRISVTEDGLLTAEQSELAMGKVTVQLENGLTYTYEVQGVTPPEWISTKSASYLIHLNESEIIYSVESDVGDLDSNQFVMCSNDERIVRCSGQTIYPVSIGSTTVTIWSIYDDVSCEVPVTVIAPTNALYIDGQEVGSLSVPIDSDPVKLPDVTDYYGNKVNVTWEKIHDSPGVGNPKTYSVSLNKTKGTVTANWRDGAGAELQATSGSGATIRLYVSPYIRAEAASFRYSEYSIHVGERAQVSFSADPSTNNATLESQDVTFTVAGDADSVSVENASLSYYTFVGLKPGTVTLTARLWNGRQYTATVTVTAYEPCAEGHAPSWSVVSPASVTRNGLLEGHCMRCGLVLATEVIPCSGKLGFSQEDFFVRVGDSIKLGSNVNGSQKYSFTWISSDPTVAAVQADTVTGVKVGTAAVTVSTGDCEPVACRIHVVQDGAVNVLRLPKNLRTIEAAAFEGVTATYVILPSGVESIGGRAFADCPYLTTVIIPASVRVIDDTAFAGSSQVTFECPPGSYAENYAGNHGIPVIP